jgi:hypothetical protein
MERTNAMLQVNHPSLTAEDFNQLATRSPRLGKHASVYAGLALLLLGFGTVAASALLESDAKHPRGFDISAPMP